MDIIILVLILSGIIVMFTNIYRYARFIDNSKDVLSANKKTDDVWRKIGLILLIFFLCGYIGIILFEDADLLMAFILFGGSIFVAIVLTLMFNLIDTVKERSLDVAEVLIGIIEARDSNLNGHSRYVQNLSLLFLKYIPADMKKEIGDVNLGYAALFHDVGKLGVPENILNKPGKLNEDEWKVIKKHPRTGVEILKPLKSFENILPWIEYHHERIDGKGYYGLQGEDIPFAARIIAIADSYSAITMKRSYKPGIAHEDAIKIIKDVAGTQLDAELVDIFCRIPKEELVDCIPEYMEI